jgi:hypothetical protein
MEYEKNLRIKLIFSYLEGKYKLIIIGWLFLINIFPNSRFLINEDDYLMRKCILLILYTYMSLLVLLMIIKCFQLHSKK